MRVPGIGWPRTDCSKLQPATRWNAGQGDWAYELAERCSYESLMTRGNQSGFLEWLGHLPPEEVDHLPWLLLAAAWSLAAERSPRRGRSPGGPHPGATGRRRRTAPASAR